MLLIAAALLLIKPGLKTDLVGRWRDPDAEIDPSAAWLSLLTVLSRSVYMVDGSRVRGLGQKKFGGEGNV